MKLLIAVLLLVFSTSAMAEWTYLTSNADKTFDVYIDKATIRKQGNVAKMWTMTDFKLPQESAGGGAGGKSYSSNNSFQEYDCVEIRDSLLSLGYFSENMGKGKGTSAQYDDGKWRDIPPNSIGMTVWEAACKK